MKTTILLTTFILLTSCGSIHNKPNEIDTAKGDFEVIVVDGCEYLFKKELISHAGYMTHKGNCRQCVERERELHKH
jgi:hypothetical protein